MPPTNKPVAKPTATEIPTGIFRGTKVFPAKRCIGPRGPFTVVEVLGSIDGFDDLVRVSINPAELAGYIVGAEIVGEFVPREKGGLYVHPDTGVSTWQGFLAPTPRSFAAKIAAITAAAASLDDVDAE